MAIGPVGNAIFVNQQTASVASVANAHNNRVDFQNMVAQAAVQEKDEKVLEVRPAEENHAIDPDREHQKNEAEQETERNEHEDDQKEKEKEHLSKTNSQVHMLDIKV